MSDSKPQHSQLKMQPSIRNPQAPAARTCATCCSFDPELSLCIHLGTVEAESYCDDHETEAEYDADCAHWIGFRAIHGIPDSGRFNAWHTFRACKRFMHRMGLQGQGISA
ncbi:hypothetical protein [Ideonella sp.]|uniref:hypothetical protein n=1 Tax=Ideonella sp. TaxID=1929293 RepID=UPI003BB775BF